MSDVVAQCRCGSKAFGIVTNGRGGYVQVQCVRCGRSGPKCTSDRYAVEAWRSDMSGSFVPEHWIFREPGAEKWRK